MKKLKLKDEFFKLYKQNKMDSADTINFLSKILRTHQKLRFSEWITIRPKDEALMFNVKVNPKTETADITIDEKILMETVNLVDLDRKLTEYGYQNNQKFKFYKEKRISFNENNDNKK